MGLSDWYGKKGKIPGLRVGITCGHWEQTGCFKVWLFTMKCFLTSLYLSFFTWKWEMVMIVMLICIHFSLLENLLPSLNIFKGHKHQFNSSWNVKEGAGLERKVIHSVWDFTFTLYLYSQCNKLLHNLKDERGWNDPIERCWRWLARTFRRQREVDS